MSLTSKLKLLALTTFQIPMGSGIFFSLIYLCRCCILLLPSQMLSVITLFTLGLCSAYSLSRSANASDITAQLYYISDCNGGSTPTCTLYVLYDLVHMKNATVAKFPWSSIRANEVALNNKAHKLYYQTTLDDNGGCGNQVIFPLPC